MSRPTASVAGPDDRSGIAALRTRVFVDEQGVPPEIEQDAADSDAVHALSRDGSRRGGGHRPAPARGTTGRRRIGRMAADASVRGRGHGAAVLAELHRQAVLHGVTEVELHAQVGARRFYERAGYTAVGEEYEEAGIAHVTMRPAAAVTGGRGRCDGSVRM